MRRESIARIAALCAGALIAAPIAGYEVNGNAITLTPDDLALCRDQGGCMLLTYSRYLAQIKRAQDDGAAQACRPGVRS